MSNDISCGIDFGTSNSTAAIASADKKTLVPLEGNKTTLPSSIFFSKAGPVFGREAMEAYLEGEEGRLLRGLKKILGTSLTDEKTLVGGKSVSFLHILTIFVAQLKSRTEAFAKNSIDNVVMGRPVHFHDNDQTADQKAQDTLLSVALSAGFKNVEFLYEPIAAAFAHESKVAGEKLTLVIDLGGGTSDFTIIRISQSRIGKADRRDDILSTSGVRIGGTTFDYRLSMKSFMPALGLGTDYRDLFDPKKLLPVPSGVYGQLSDWSLIHFAQTKKALAETLDIKKRAVEENKLQRLWTLQYHHLGHALLQKVEESKIAVTPDAGHQTFLKDLGDRHEFLVTQNDLDTAIENDVEKIFNSVTECLQRAGVHSGQIDLVILTGGSTELPVIGNFVKAMFPQAEISQENKLDSVGLGLAYQAATLFAPS